MPKPLSEDIRKRVVKAVLAGHSRHAVAGTYAVSVSFVVKLLQRWQARGSWEPAQFGGYKKSLLAAHAEQVKQLVGKQPDATVTELWEQLNANGITVSRAAVGKYLQRLRLTYKKNAARGRTGKSRRSGSARRLA